MAWVMRPQGFKAPGRTVKLEQSGRRLQVYLGEQGTGCLSHYVNCLVSEFQRWIIKLCFKGRGLLNTIFGYLIARLTFGQINFELFQSLWGIVCCLQRLRCYPWSSRIRFPWWGSIFPWNMYHNYKTFNACSIATHWQHLTSFKIKTIFLYEFQLLASWTNIEDSLRVIKMIITFPI